MDQIDSLEREFEIDPELLNDELDEDEQDLEDEYHAMLKAWDKEEFEKSLKEDMKLMQRKTENEAADFYDGDTDFDKIAEDMTPLDDQRKVLIKIIESNPTGKEINADTTILYDNVGYLEFEPTPFASSLIDGKPTKTNLAIGPILVGLLKGLISMREGERANILIHPSMAFGSLGCLPIIPGDSTILYQIKVYKVWANSALDSVLDAERSEFFETPNEDIIRLVEEHKTLANDYLKDGQPRDAIIRYKMGIKRLDEISMIFLERTKGKELLQTLLQNCSLALNSLGMHKSASKYAKRALLLEPRSLKAHYQLIKAKIGVGDWDAAERLLDTVDKISPNNPSFKPLKQQLDELSSTMKQKRDEIERKMSKGLLSSS